MKASELIERLKLLSEVNGEDLEVYWRSGTNTGYDLVRHAELAVGMEGDKMACLSCWGMKFFEDSNRRSTNQPLQQS